MTHDATIAGLGHLLMHKVPVLWNVHWVHHCDSAVDVTTTIRLLRLIRDLPGSLDYLRRHAA